LRKKKSKDPADQEDCNALIQKKSKTQMFYLLNWYGKIIDES
jgi:hypothetical protein